jgi:hypothetical protein
MTDEKPPKKLRAFMRIDVATGRRTRIGPGVREEQRKQNAEAMARRREPVLPPAPVSPQPKKGKGKKKAAEVPRHLATTPEKILHEWDRTAVGADLDTGKTMTTVQVRRSLRQRLVRVGCDEFVQDCMEFIRAWEIAERGIRGQSFEIGVDGGRPGRTELAEAKILAAEQLAACKARIGDIDYRYCVAFLCHGIDVSDIHAAGGHEHRIVSDRIRRAIRRLAYRHTPDLEPDRTDLAIDLLIRRAEMGVADA